MDVYEYAIQMEKDGENYYRELVQRVSNAGLKNILTMLADAEVVHYRIFTRMKSSEPVELQDSSILANVKNIFIKMKDEGDVITAEGSEIELYRKAQELEEKTRDFYRSKSLEMADPDRGVLLRIADEEQKHFLILESIISFVNRPFEWLENAEWYHLEEY